MSDDLGNPEIVIVEDDNAPAREMNPVVFFGPHGAPVADRDFRPVAIPFDNTQDVITEDGHGNFSTDSHVVTPVHPSQKRDDQPYLRKKKVEDDQLLLNLFDEVPEGTDEPEVAEEPQAVQTPTTPKSPFPMK